MGKDGQRECPDCAGPDLGTLFGGKGNGKCHDCRGEGKIYGIEDIVSGLAGFDNFHTCRQCSGTGQCQTCGGTGYQYYYEGNTDDQNTETGEYSTYERSDSSYDSYSSYDSSYPSSSTPSSYIPQNYEKSNE